MGWVAAAGLPAAHSGARHHPEHQQCCVFFSPPGSDRLREGDERRLSQWVLRLAPQIQQAMRAGESIIRVDGFSSTTAALGFNRDLSRRRAERVAQLLRDLLGPNARIETRAMGEVTARTADRTETERERRVEVTVLHTRRVTAAAAVPVRTPAMAR